MPFLLPVWTFLKGVPSWAWLALAGVLLVVGAALWLDARDTKNQAIGGKVQREGDLRETIKRTEQANEARDDIRNDRDSARYNQCLRTARTPANCQRFLPGSETN